MLYSFFHKGELKKILREFSEPDNVFDTKASFYLQYSDEKDIGILCRIHVNKVYYGYIYPAELEEKYERLIGGKNEESYDGTEKYNIKPTNIDLTEKKGETLVFNQYCDVNYVGRDTFHVVKDGKQMSITSLPNKKYDSIYIHFSFFCIKYVSSFFAAIHEHLKEDGSLYICENIFTVDFHKKVYTSIYKDMLSGYFTIDFNPRFLTGKDEFPAFDLYNTKEFKGKVYQILEYKKKSFVPKNLFSHHDQYDILVSAKKKGAVNSVEKIKNDIFFVIDDKNYREEKYPEIFSKIKTLISPSQVIAFNKKDLEKNERWEKFYLELKKFAYTLKNRIILVKKKNE